MSEACRRCHGKGTEPDYAAEGAALRKMRQASGVSLREVARGAGLSAPYLCDVELGRRRVTTRVLVAYRKELGR